MIGYRFFAFHKTIQGKLFSLHLLNYSLLYFYLYMNNLYAQVKEHNHQHEMPASSTVDFFNVIRDIIPPMWVLSFKDKDNN